MRTGVVVSLVGHGVLVVAGLVALPNAPLEERTQFDSLPVEFIEIAEFTELAIGLDVSAPAPVEAPVAEPALEPEPAPAEPQAPEAVAAIPEVDAAEPLPELAPEPEPVPQPEPAPDPVPAGVVPVPVPRPRQQADLEPEPDPERAVGDAPGVEPAEPDRIAALLDGPADPAPIAPGVENGPEATQLTRSEIDALAASIADCWYPPNGWSDPAEVRVVVQFSLNREGTVIGVPSVIEAPTGRYALAATQRALSAVRSCAPYDQLPPDKYENWQDVRITFDPIEMFLP